MAKAKFLKSKVGSLQTVSFCICVEVFIYIIQEKDERMKQLKGLAETEGMLCSVLDETNIIVPFYNSKVIPSEEKLKEFVDIIQNLENKKVKSCVCSHYDCSNNFRLITKQSSLL